MQTAGEKISSEENINEAEKAEVVPAETKEDPDSDEYEKVCVLCHRPESAAGNGRITK